MTHASQNHHAQDHDGFGQAETLGADKALHGSEHGTGHTTKAGAHGKCQQLDVARIDAHGLGGDLVFTHRLPGAAYARVLQAHAHDHNDDGQEQQQVIVFFGPGDTKAKHLLRAAEGELAYAEAVDPIDTLRSVGDIDGRIQVVHEDAHDLAEAQRNDGQVVSAQ